MKNLSSYQLLLIYGDKIIEPPKWRDLARYVLSEKNVVDKKKYFQNVLKFQVDLHKKYWAALERERTSKRYKKIKELLN